MSDDLTTAAFTDTVLDEAYAANAEFDLTRGEVVLAPVVLTPDAQAESDAIIAAAMPEAYDVNDAYDAGEVDNFGQQIVYDA